MNAPYPAEWQGGRFTRAAFFHCPRSGGVRDAKQADTAARGTHGAVAIEDIARLWTGVWVDAIPVRGARFVRVARPRQPPERRRSRVEEDGESTRSPILTAR